MIKLSRRTAIRLATSAFVPVPAAIAAGPEDDTRAPFGLTWGMSADDVRNLGAQLVLRPGQTEYGVSFGATNLAKVLSDMEGALLSFGHKDRLWRIAAIGRSIGHDPTGDRVVARYQEIAASLSDRYGRGTETDSRDLHMWKRHDEYVMSLSQGRASRYTMFHTSNIDIELSVRASGSDQAYYLILFESGPEARAFAIDKKAHEKDAL